jgi:hypothetical protein
MNDNDDQQIQMGELTSHVTVIDEDALLSPQQLERISEMVLEKLESRLRTQQQRRQDQAIGGSNNGGWPR